MAYRKLLVENLTHDFRKATSIKSLPIPTPKQPNILVKNNYVGINASDVNFTSGKYYPGKKPPFPVGFEGVGTIVETGQPVAYLFDGAFSEYHEIPSSRVMPIPEPKPEYVGLLVSGMTAKLALDHLGGLKKDRASKVLVTAAAGGTGHIFAQLAKLENEDNLVIGTTSSDEKCKFLDRFVDVSLNLSEVKPKSPEFDNLIKKHAPNGLDLVYESVGRDLFDACLRNLALKSTMITLGYIQGYKEDGIRSAEVTRRGGTIPVHLLMKSASLRGFFLFHYANEWKRTFQQLCELVDTKKLNVHVDKGFGSNVSDEFRFNGIDQIADAVEYLYTRKSVGKIVVKI